MLDRHGLDDRSLVGNGLRGHGLRGRGLNVHGLSGHGLRGHGLSGHGLSGRGLSGHGLSGRGRKRLDRGVYGALVGLGIRDGRGLDRGDLLGKLLGLGPGPGLELGEHRVMIVMLAGGGRLGICLPGALGAPAFALLTRALALLRCAFLRLP